VVRLQAAVALCDLIDDHRIEQALLILVRDAECGDSVTRDRVYETLVGMASRAIPHLLDALEDHNHSDDVKELVIEVLARVQDPRVPGALFPFLSSRKRTLHWKARWALQRLSRTTEPFRAP
jgi:HEAT repeat protein